MKESVDFDNRSDVADWLASTMERAFEVADIAAAALEPKSKRVLSKAELRRELAAAVAELQQLHKAARRGLRAPAEKP